MRKVLTGNVAVAYGAMLADVQVVPAYPTGPAQNRSGPGTRSSPAPFPAATDPTADWDPQRPRAKGSCRESCPEGS